MRRVVVVLALTLALAGCRDQQGHPSPEPGSHLHRLADAPFPDHTGSAFVAVGDKLLLFGGTRFVDCEGMMFCPIGDEIRSMVVYDPDRDRWSRLPDLPDALVPQPRVTTNGDQLIATRGGLFFVFDLPTQEWRTFSPPPIDPANAEHLLAHGQAVYVLTTASDPESPVQRLDLRTGDWTVMTRDGLGSATTRSIFWTQVGLVSAGYDSASGAPVPAVARFDRGRWHRFAPPPEPISPATYRLWGGGVAMPGPRHGAPQYLDVARGTWTAIPQGTMTFDERGMPTSMELGTSDDEEAAVIDGTLYALSARSQLRERALFTR